MQPVEFEKDIYFGIVAENLTRNLGDKALGYAHEALRKMKALGDQEGFDLWLEIERRLTDLVIENAGPASRTLH